MSRPTILLDIDGVLCDFTGGIEKVIKKVTGQDYRITKWMNISSMPFNGWEKASIVSRISDIGFARNLSVLDGAYQGVAELRKIADLHFVTTGWKSDTWEKDRRWWMKFYGFASNTRSEITFMEDKWRISGDVFVDDKMENVAAWQAKWPLARAIAWAQPWNADYPGRRMSKWSELIKLVGEMSQ